MPHRNAPLLCMLAALLLAACVAQPAATTPAATAIAPAALPPVTAVGHMLQAGGEDFEMRGVNYIHPTTADLSTCSALNFGADANCPWEIVPIEADFDHLRRLGVNTIRVFLNYYVFGGAQLTDPSYRMDYALEHLDALIAAANARGIYVMPVLLAKYPQDQFGAQNAESALRIHVRPVVEHLRGRPGIIVWDLFNELDLGGPVDERCWDWDNGDYAGCLPLAEQRLAFIKVVHDEVKKLDPERLVTTSVGFAKSYFRPEKASIRLADVVDLYSFHYYDDDPYNSGRYAAHWYYGKGFPADLRTAAQDLYNLGLDKPLLVTELGFPTGAGSKRSDDDLVRDLRTARATARELQLAGMLLWPFQNDPDLLLSDLFTRR